METLEFLLFRVLGTPNEDSWPNCTALPDYKTSFPQWYRQDLALICPKLSKKGIELVEVRRKTQRLTKLHNPV